MESQVADLDVARARHRRAARQRRALRWGILAGFVVLVGVVVYVVAFSSVLALTQVKVTGTSLVTAKDVTRQAAAPMGAPLVRLDTAQIADRVGQLAPVKHVTVTRNWPHGVTIAIVERTPVVQRKDASEYQWIDENGTVLNTTLKPAPGVPIATTVSDKSQDLAHVATIVAALGSDLTQQVTAIDQKTTDQVTITLTKNRTVLWGGPEQSDLKAQVLAALLTVKASTYDVSSPAHPTTR